MGPGYRLVQRAQVQAQIRRAKPEGRKKPEIRSPNTEMRVPRRSSDFGFRPLIGACAFSCSNKRFDLLEVLFAWTRFDAAGNVYRIGLHQPDGIGDVLGGQATGEKDGLAPAL